MVELLGACGIVSRGNDHPPPPAMQNAGPVACENATAPAFLKACAENRREVMANVIEADCMASAIQNFMAKRTQWSGTATTLLQELRPSTYLTPMTLLTPADPATGGRRRSNGGAITAPGSQ